MNPIIAANWKLNLTKSDVLELITNINENMTDIDGLELIISPSYPYLELVSSTLKKGMVAAQNMALYERGAYTGEVSGEMIKSCGASHVILGHSERRHTFNETNDMIKVKLSHCRQLGLTPILCVGETLAERNSGQLKSVIESQLAVLSEFSGPYYIAYEPVWAIGTGETATPEIANDVHAFIRGIIGKNIPILYGGSVNEKNIEGLLSMPSIDGALIGGASLKATEFSSILSISNSLERTSK